MTFRPILLSTLLLFSFATVYARKEGAPRTDITTNYSNSIKAGISTVFTPGWLQRISLNRMHQFGFSYERHISGKWLVGIGYCQWTDWNTHFGDIPSKVMRRLPSNYGEGEFIYALESYKMADLNLFYKLPFCGERHLLYAGPGITTAWGKIGSISPVKNKQGEMVDQASLQKNNIDLGVASQVSYDYLLLHHRLSLGADIKFRQFFTIPYRQIDFGVHAGFNF